MLISMFYDNENGPAQHGITGTDIMTSTVYTFNKRYNWIFCRNTPLCLYLNENIHSCRSH